jgi:tetraacyldisaccharide 4'-kinase
VLRVLLFPFALIYDAITTLRNMLYDMGYKPSASFDVPVIGIGNISVGGTGKTPMTEYLIRLFYPQYKIVTLSRGYGRKTTGFRIASTQDNSSSIGDEPYQIYQKFGSKVKVTVGEERALAIANIMHEFPDTEVIVMDDAFQHRKVKPGFQVVLTELNNPFYNDYLLPAGRLRESRQGIKRADAIVITKCPADLSIEKMMEVEKCVREYSDKPVFFATIRYGNPVAISDQANFQPTAVLVSGIANPQPFVDYARSQFTIVRHFDFRDHHDYTISDIRSISEVAKRENAIILTTEKDAVKINTAALRSAFSGLSVFYLPIETTFIRNGKDFDEMVLNALSTRDL